MEQGLVRTTGKYHGKPGVGRMATGLEINPGFGLVLGIEVQTESFRWVLVDLDGTVIKTNHETYEKQEGCLAAQLCTLFGAVRKSIESDGRQIIGIGIGLSGIVDPYEGIIRYSYPLNIAEPLRLGDQLAEKLGIPVFIENDANCCCWSEMAFRRTPQGRNFLALLGEFRNIDISDNRKTGIAFGIGIAIRENVLHGDNFTAGEFRSLLYDHENPSHSQFAITDSEAARLPEDRTVLLKVFNDLAYNVSLLVNTLDITKIVVTGEFARYSSELTPLLEREIRRNWLYQTPRKCSIECSSDGEYSVCIGGAGLFIQKLFSVPGMTDHIDEAVGYILLEKILSPDKVPVA